MRCLLLLTLGLILASGAALAQEKRAGQPQATDANVRYGEHPRNVLDVYQVDADRPTPVLIFFHGGGFVAGDKAHAQRMPLARACQESGITVISANYRFVAGPDSEPFPGSLHDGVRVVQFVRANAQRWNIDPQQVVVSGGSAGGLMSIWIGVHDDFADADSDDPVERQSSRVAGVIGYGAQSTTDPEIILKEIGGHPEIHPSIFPIYGVRTMADLTTPEMRRRITDYSSLSHVTKNDPPMWLGYGGTLAGTPLPPDASVGVSIHHATFGTLLRTKYEQVKAPSQIQVVCEDCPDNGQTELDFLRHVLRLKTPAAE